jgi:hypothetical protein
MLCLVDICKWAVVVVVFCLFSRQLTTRIYYVSRWWFSCLFPNSMLEFNIFWKYLYSLLPERVQFECFIARGGGRLGANGGGSRSVQLGLCTDQLLTTCPPAGLMFDSPRPLFLNSFLCFTNIIAISDKLSLTLKIRIARNVEIYVEDSFNKTCFPCWNIIFFHLSPCAA